MNTEWTSIQEGDKVRFRLNIRGIARDLRGATGVAVRLSHFDNRRDVLCIRLDDRRLGGYFTDDEGHGYYRISGSIELVESGLSQEKLINDYTIE